MTARVAVKQRTAALKLLREQYKDSVERTQALLKAQQAVRKQLCQRCAMARKLCPKWQRRPVCPPIRYCGTSPR